MSVRFTFGATDVYVSATSTLSRLLESTLRRHAPPARAPKTRFASRSVAVHLSPPDRSPEFVLRLAQREIAAEIAAAHGWLAIDAVVVERDGQALVLRGAAGSGKSTIAANLLARGWKLLTDDVAFVDEERGTIIGHHGLMHFRAGAIAHLPVGFKASLERSRWFVGEDGEMQFYEVDPAAVFGADVWSNEAEIAAVVTIDPVAASADGVMSLPTAIGAIDGSEIHSAVFERVRSGCIGLDRSVRLTDRIEQWYERDDVR